MLTMLQGAGRAFKPSVLFERMRLAFGRPTASAKLLATKPAAPRAPKTDRRRRAAFILEPVEQRLLLSGDISVGMAAGVNDLTVRMEDVNGVAMIRVLDNDDGSLVAEGLAADVTGVRITGTADRKSVV